MIIPAKTHSRGFTLVEVMVALVILAIGLLGMATLMMNSLQSNESAYSRSQATLMAYDILDRMRANKVASSNPAQSFRVTHASVSEDYLLDSIDDCPEEGAGDPNGAGAQKAEADLAQWCVQLQENIPSLLSSTSIEPGDEEATYILTIEWQQVYDSNGDGNPDTGTLVVEAQL
ncbi:type IV pilus modification protein PilV [Pseudomonas sp. NPDC077382]